MTAERDRERLRLVSAPALCSPEAVPAPAVPAGGTARATSPARRTRFDAVGASHLAPTATELEQLRRVANGAQEADLVIRGGMMVVVQTGELRRRDLLIAGRFIAAVTRPGTLGARRSLDASGRYLLPAYIDPYVRLEQTLLTPGELARLVVPRGTVTLLVDAGLPVALCGPRGAPLVTTSGTPVRLLARTSPAGAGTGTRADASLPDTRTWLPRQSVPLIGPADLSLPGMAGTGAVSGLPDLDGTAVGDRAAGDRGVDGLAVADLAVDDLAVDAPLELSGAWKITDIVDHGHLDRVVRRTVGAGVEPMTAIRMATLDPARRYGLDHLLGSLAPAHLADIQIVSDIAGSRPPEIVLVNGRMAAERGRPLFDNLDVLPDWGRERVTLPPGLFSGSFAVAATAAGRESAGTVRGVQVSVAADGTAGVEIVAVRPGPTTGGTGHVVADPGHDLLKVALVTRGADRAGGMRVGFIRGIGLRQGAIAMTTSVAPGDLAVIGVADQDMMTAVRALEGMCGGFVVVDRGWVLAACPLPVAGLMSDASWEAVRDQLAGVDSAAAALGCTIASPFLTLAPLGGQLCHR
ncbi:adenine deaminase C-terminal domain-containing protein [Frankia sp. Cr2]|uniref:adenine deaminase C-terminal domain-containing protein n=1 Tax=Frankia sp. Cr2 TaxID=3073932 RepID=UPI002AD3BE8C|nr:adenine deaminase C-terminal domain-containing protein [Frankia sp. Cr2]